MWPTPLGWYSSCGILKQQESIAPQGSTWQAGKGRATCSDGGFAPLSLLCLFPRAAITKYCRLGGLEPENGFSHSSGSQKPRLKVSAGPCSL